MKTFDFSSARTKHLSWKTKLQGFLSGKESMTEAQAISERDCDLGKWLYSEGLSKYKSIKEMTQLEIIHTRMHATVRLVVTLKNKGDTDGAEREFHKITGLSNQVVELLRTIEGKVNAVAVA